MKLISRISICALCLLTSFSTTGYANEILTKSPENLDKQFVEIKVSNEYAMSVSVFATIQNLTQYVQAKYYSLLNWQTKSRASDLEIGNYDRIGQFGRWVNDPQDELCLNTRAKVLLRDSKKNVVYKETNHCVVAEGAWKDPYTAHVYKTAQEIQIDHLVPLKNAYMSGAHRWDFKTRCLYANYLGYDFHLLSVFGTENMKKSDRAPDQYMPPDSRYACTYIRNWLAVKMMWGLTMSISEASAVRQIMIDQNCAMSTFRLSNREMLQHRQFVEQNINICEKIDPSAI